MELRLPTSVTTKTDLGRLLREVAAVDSLMNQAKLRSHPSANQLPSLSHTLSDLLESNNLDISDEAIRKNLAQTLEGIYQNSRQIQISFASEPSAQVLEKIVNWFRQNVDPLILLQVGLQPTIAAGCVVRTPNKVFDLSLRSYLEAKEPELTNLIRGVVGGTN